MSQPVIQSNYDGELDSLIHKFDPVIEKIRESQLRTNRTTMWVPWLVVNPLKQVKLLFNVAKLVKFKAGASAPVAGGLIAGGFFTEWPVWVYAGGAVFLWYVMTIVWLLWP
ncbi:MAG TPA: hypothetical protein VFV52_12075 [Bacilli bacterium]|nr:hypothetical protein [Bacilli bacterium]